MWLVSSGSLLSVMLITLTRRCVSRVSSPSSFGSHTSTMVTEEISVVWWMSGTRRLMISAVCVRACVCVEGGGYGAGREALRGRW